LDHGGNCMYKLLSFLTVGLLILLTWVVNITRASPNTSEGSIYRVRTIEIGELGIKSPSGLAFSPDRHDFLVMDSPRNNPGNDKGASLAAISLYGKKLTYSTSFQSTLLAPLKIAYEEKTHSLFIIDQTALEMRQFRDILPGGLGSSPRESNSFDLRPLGLAEAQGMTIDSQEGRIYILDAEKNHIVSFLLNLHTEVAVETSTGVNSIRQIDLDGFAPGELQGIAFNDATSHLYVMNVSKHQLYELSATGLILQVWDLSNLNLHNPQALVFAPNGDPTDDPSSKNLYILDPGSNPSQFQTSPDGGIIEVSLNTAEGSPNMQEAINEPTARQAVLVNTIYTSLWSPPSPDPAGISHLPGTQKLLISDSEVDEMSIFTGKNIYITDLSGNLLATCTTIQYSNEPTGVTVNPDNGHIFYSDDNALRVWEVNLGADQQYCTADDTTTYFRTDLFNSFDPEGIAYGQGKLFISDGVGKEVYTVSPGADGIFNGIPPTGDDVVTSFDTSIYPDLSDPEGIEYNPDHNTLFIVGTTSHSIIETTLTGELVESYDISFLGSIPKSGLAYGPGTQNQAVKNIFLVSRGVDNNVDPNENDGKLFEISLGSSPTPTGPTPTPTSTRTLTPTLTGTPGPSSTPTPTNAPNPTNTPTVTSGVAFWDDFDPVKEGWMHSANQGIDDWGPSSARSHSPVTSYFSSEPATVKDDYLLTRVITVPANGQLTFWHTYKMENGFDGSVIEISTDGGGTFTDLGSHITSGGYTGVISRGSPIAGRQAWTGGTLGVWSQVVVDLGTYAGQNVILRFRMTSDNGKAGLGWYIDDVRVAGTG